jgi:hypothetical protein
MHIIHLQQQDRLVDNAQPLTPRQVALALDASEKLRERHDTPRLLNLVQRRSFAGFFIRQELESSRTLHTYLVRYALKDDYGHSTDLNLA